MQCTHGLTMYYTIYIPKCTHKIHFSNFTIYYYEIENRKSKSLSILESRKKFQVSYIHNMNIIINILHVQCARIRAENVFLFKFYTGRG